MTTVFIPYINKSSSDLYSQQYTGSLCSRNYFLAIDLQYEMVDSSLDYFGHHRISQTGWIQYDI